MKLLLFLALAVALHAEDVPKATSEELTKQVAEQKQENERLTKMLNAYAQKYLRCDQELTVLQTLGVPANQPQRRALATLSEPSKNVAEPAKEKKP